MMYLKLFLVALASFVIPSCTEDYSQYKEEFYHVNSTQSRNTSNTFYEIQEEIERNNHTDGSINIFEELEGFYHSDLRYEALTELQNDELSISNKPNLNTYDKKLKSRLKELKEGDNLSKIEIQETDKLLERLKFYKSKKERIYRMILLNTYLELEKYSFIGYKNRIMKRRFIDTIRVGEECKVLLKSSDFNKELQYLEYDSIKFSVDGIEMKMNYSLKIIDEIGILTFTPNQEGLYSIRGERNIVLNYNSRKKIANSFFRQKNVQK